jgi:hypothetical protein
MDFCAIVRAYLQQGTPSHSRVFQRAPVLPSHYEKQDYDIYEVGNGGIERP